MSPWDRQAVIRRYARRFDETEDPEKLMDMLGTATKVAVMLADGYVSSPPPSEADASEPEIGTFAEEEQLTFAEMMAMETEDASSEKPDSVPRRSAGAVAGYLFFVLLVGLPVSALLFCLGLPFMVSGAGVIGAAAQTALATAGALRLFSDRLLLFGGALMLAAAGLLLVWLGLWIGIALVRLWIARVVLPLGGRLGKRKGAGAA